MDKINIPDSEFYILDYKSAQNTYILLASAAPIKFDITIPWFCFGYNVNSNTFVIQTNSSERTEYNLTEFCIHAKKLKIVDDETFNFYLDYINGKVFNGN